ncbi:MAG: TonB-dependent receptor [Arachidicoccus sp.]|nr:TonB-dependent receptor [Arachidicoccus sp.]
MIKLAATRKFHAGFFSDILVGYDHTEHTKDKDGKEGYLGLPDGASQAVIPEKYRTGTTDADFLGNNGGMVSYDALAMYKDGYFTSSTVNTSPYTNGTTAYYWSGSGGNPGLKPWKANNYDLSIEHYFGRKGYVSVAGFYKDLTTFIYSQTLTKDYTGVALSSACYSDSAHTIKVIDNDEESPYYGQWVCANADANRIGTTTAQANGHGGYIKGVELTVSVPGELLTPWLDGFGVIWSASFNDSSINPSGTNAYDVPGLSKKVMNTTVHYEKHGFSARISNRYRGDFLGEVPDYTNSLSNTWVHSESVIDAQISYSFNDGPLNGLTLNVSGSNLSNEPFYTY